MRFHYDESMKKRIVTYGSVALIAIVIFFAFYNLTALKSYFAGLFGLISPFILGFAIAFLLNKPMMFIEEKGLNKLRIKQGHKRTLAAIAALILGIFIVGLFFYLLIPQLWESIHSLVETFPKYISDFQIFVEAMIEENHLDLDEIQKLFGNQDIFARLTDFVSNALPQMARLSYGFMNMLLNVVLGIMSALYMLLDKEKLCRHTRIAVYALLPNDTAEYLITTSRKTADIFNNFIVGKAIDSLIIGVLCYIGMSILQLPYAILLSVIVGITNMIPVFGPFIGAVPGVFILMIIHPIDAVYFALFILLLQQFDGNILGPLILGDKLGLPSLWILFAVCVGGGLFGIIGMFIGVPLFAVVYMLAKELFAYRLQKKQMTLSDFNEIAENENSK
ncbi:MAG: AI-2E family transporter [Erysipelotrichaceae bacterium]|nr:AI-2E family transporter [Erysipelotrichaceae bacterium]